MTYRVELEIYEPSTGADIPVGVPDFGAPQHAADYARRWVTDQPADAERLPRAKMYRNGKPNGLRLSVWRKPNGEICERRTPVTNSEEIAC